MARSAAAQAEDNRRRQAAGQAPRPIATDPGRPLAFNPNTSYGTTGYGQTRPNYPSTRPAAAPAAQPAPQPQQPQPFTPQDKPGYGERHYQDYGYQWQQPGASTEYWNGQQGYFTGGPTAQENQIDYYGNRIGQTPGAMEDLYGQYNNAGQFTRPGASENWYGQNQPFYNTPGQGENWYAQHQGAYDQRGDAENFFSQHGDQFTQPGYLQQHGGEVADQYGDTRSTQDFWGQTGQQLAGPGFAENMARDYKPEASYSENFLTGGAGEGLDKLYGRMFDVGSKRLDKAAAARGGFNSGAALRSQEELNADLTAQQVKDTMLLTNQADAAKMARLGHGLDVMKGGDESMRGRLDIGFRGATAADKTGMERGNAMRDLYEGMSKERQDDFRLAGDWADRSQGYGLQRLGMGSEASDRAQGRALDRMAQGSLDADRAQSAEDRRVRTGMDFSAGAQDREFDRYKTAAELAAERQRMENDRYRTGGDLANSADASQATRLAGGQSAATAAQNSQENRQGNEFDRWLGLGGAQAGTYGSGMDAARNEERQSFMEEINGLINKGRLSAEEIMAKYGARMANLGLIMQGGQIVMGGMGGGNVAAGQMSPPGFAPQPSDPRGQYYPRRYLDNNVPTYGALPTGGTPAPGSYGTFVA
jgi:hypothetical protein